MRFDENEYRDNFLRRHRGARGAPGDLLERYAITLPATDAEIRDQLRKVRACWNKFSSGRSSIAQVAKLCRAEDERLRERSDALLDSRAWWEKQQTERQKTAEKSVNALADELKRRYGNLGVVSSGTLRNFADTHRLSDGQAGQAARLGGLTVISGVTLPEREPVKQFPALAKAMSECAAPSVPELVHPEAGAFRIVERYECLTDHRKRLDMAAVADRIQGADRQRKSATVDALRSALQILNTAVRGGVSLDEVALYHAVTVARRSAATSPETAAADLRQAGVEDRDAAVIAVLVAETSVGTGAGPPDVASLLSAGRLREAKAAIAALPADHADRAELSRRAEDAQRRLDTVLAEAKAALAVPDETRAESLLKDAELISAEDAATELAAVPLPPPADLRAPGDGAELTLFWRPAPGHDQNTAYVVRRGEQPRSLTAPSEGEHVYRGGGDTCTDQHAPVARPVQYAVFATRDGRPPSRPATVAASRVPPVANLRGEAGTATATLSWSALPEARIEVTRTGPGQAPVRVPVNGSGCRANGLPEGQQQHFEVTAVYTGPDGRELRAVPQRVSVTPQPEAKPLMSLRARTVGASGAIRVRVTWRAADQPEIKIVRCDREPEFGPGTTVTQAQMAAAGEEVTGSPLTSGRESGFDADLPAGVHRLVPFSIGGTGIVVGKPVTVAVADPVRHLSSTVFADYALVSWEWPVSAQAAEVLWRTGGIEDVARIDRGQYRSRGGFEIPLGLLAPCEVEVRALVTVGQADFTSPPAVTTIGQVMRTSVRYDVVRIGPARLSRSRKLIFTSDQECAGIRVRVVAWSRGIVPTRPQDGEPILEKTLTLRPGTPHPEKIVLPRGTTWFRCFILTGPGDIIDPPIGKLRG